MSEGGGRRALLPATFLVTGVLLIAAEQVWIESVAASALYLAVGGLASAALAVAGGRRAGSHRWDWLLMALGAALFMAGDAVWTWYDLSGAEVPVLSVADVLYVGAYVPLAVGLLRFTRDGRRGRDIDALIDGAIVGASILAATWLLAVEPSLGTEGLEPAQAVTSLYPLLDAAILALVVRLLGRRGACSAVTVLLGLGLAATFAGDIAYLLVTGGSSTEYAPWFDITWLAGYVLMGTAGLYARQVGHRARPAADDDPPGVALPRVLALGVALAMPAVLALVRMDIAERSRSLVLLTVCELVLVGLVTARLGRLATVVRRQLREARDLHVVLAHQATHDPITGLPNRERVTEDLRGALAGAAGSGGRIGVLFVDLDQFKVVNDTLGHAVGDAILQTIATRIGKVLRAGDVLGRFGGDEFVILLGGSAGDRALTAAQRVAEVVRRPISIPAFGPDELVVITATVGVVNVDDPQVSAEDVLRDADAALLDGKKRGRDLVVPFTPSMRDHVTGWLEIENDLRRALERDELRLHYQPEIELATHQLFGVEALLRWQHPDGRLVPPGEFLPVAERSGLIIPIGRWVIEEACRQARAWQDRLGDAAPPISINISPLQLAREDIATHIERNLDRHGLAPGSLRVEVTETALVSEHPHVGRQLQRLHDAGIDVAVDDFGTGFFSLSLLKRLVVDLIKIDRSFVAGIGDDRADDAIIHSVVDLARRLGARTIAEGVETRDQAARLAAAGCDVAQGFLYSRPVAAADLEHHIALDTRASAVHGRPTA